jgi:hypothetical protein
MATLCTAIVAAKRSHMACPFAFFISVARVFLPRYAALRAIERTGASFKGRSAGVATPGLNHETPERLVSRSSAQVSLSSTSCHVNSGSSSGSGSRVGSALHSLHDSVSVRKWATTTSVPSGCRCQCKVTEYDMLISPLGFLAMIANQRKRYNGRAAKARVKRGETSSNGFGRANATESGIRRSSVASVKTR